MRLTLSVGGWELPSGRHAKGCSAAVTDTAGESLPRVEKRADVLGSALLALVLADANISARDAAETFRWWVTFLNRLFAGVWLFPMSNRVKCASKSALISAQSVDSWKSRLGLQRRVLCR